MSNKDITQPNILIVMADQLGSHFTGAYGHPVVKTPFMDELSSNGARFDAAYCNSPLCAPSRFSFMSGQLISRIAAYDNASEFPASIPTFAHYLKMMGYQTCLSGKMHFVGPDQMHGFEERITTDIYPSDYAWTPNWELPDERIDKWYHNMQTVKESGVAEATFQIDYDEEVAFFAKRKLFDYARDGAEPFCMVASFIHPHDPYVARKDWWNLYKNEDIEMPKNLLSTIKQDAFSKRLMDGIEASTVKLTDEEILRARHAYFANVSYFDSKIGEIIQTLKETDFYENTNIIITSDHGDMLGERGLWYKMNFFENSARVPLIISGPSVANNAIPNACSLVDILPTVLDMAKTDTIKIPNIGMPLDGRSLFCYLKGENDTISEAVGEYCAEMAGSPVFMIRRNNYKYIHCDIDPPQLYDLEKDPFELNNIAENIDNANIVTSFKEEVLKRWDTQALKAHIIATQKQRRAVHSAMESGAIQHWDYNPPKDASKEYVRNNMDWTVTASRLRFPPLRKG